MLKNSHTNSDGSFLSLHIRGGIAGHDVVGGGVVTKESVEKSRMAILEGSMTGVGVVLEEMRRNRESTPEFVFVAADSGFLRKQAVSIVRERYGLKAATYDDSLVPPELRLGGIGLPMVAVDFFLLSRANTIIRREFSTFSMVAAAVGGMTPFLYVPCQGMGEPFSVFRERHSSGRLGTNLWNLEQSPAHCYGKAGTLAHLMQNEGFLYPSCTEYEQLLSESVATLSEG